MNKRSKQVDFFATLKINRMTIEYVMDDDEEEVEEVVCFPLAGGGFHGRGKTLEDAVLECCRINKGSGAQVAWK